MVSACASQNPVSANQPRASAASAGFTRISPHAQVDQSSRTEPWAGSAVLRSTARMPWCSSIPSSSAPAAAPADGDLYNVFLSKITDKSKQDKVAELISKVKGCSMNEAKDLTTRLVIPIAKNISKEQAEDILNQFKKIKIFGRMTKVKWPLAVTDVLRNRFGRLEAGGAGRGS